MTIDVVMLAKGSSGHLKSMTQQAINSIHASEKEINNIDMGKHLHHLLKLFLNN